MADPVHEGVAIAQIPARQPIELFSAVGCLLDAALGGAFLAPGNDRDVAAVVRAREGQSARQAAECLRAAAEALGATPSTAVSVSADGVEDEPEVTFNQMRQHDDGSVGFGIGGGAPDAAQAMAANLLAAFGPALHDAPSYIEFQFADRGTSQQYAVIVVKPDGLTPHQARQRAEAEVEQLRARLAELEVGDEV